MNIKHEDQGKPEFEIDVAPLANPVDYLSTESSENVLDYAIITPVKSVTWDDLKFMHENNWALRHVSFLQHAQDEMKNGINDGDAVSLACPQKFIKHEMGLPEIYQHYADTNYSEAKYTNLPIFLVDENLHQDVCISFEQSLKEFIKASIKMDLNRIANDDISILEALEKIISDGSSFIICKSAGAEDPYDLDGYFNLGKCGKNSIGPENIVGLISISNLKIEIINALKLADEAQLKNLTREFHEMIAVCIADVVWKKFCDLILIQQ